MTQQANPQELTIGSAHGRFKAKPISFKGRVSRSEFYLTTLLVPWGIEILALLILTLGGGISGFLSSPGNPTTWPLAIGGILFVIIQIALFLSLLGYSIRRLHDIGNRGWWVLISLIPVIGQAILLYKFLSPSNPGSNAYGEQPVETLPMNPEADENQLTLWGNLKATLKQAFTFKGRTSRHQYTLALGAAYLFYVVVSLAVGFITNLVQGLAIIDIYQKAPFLLSSSQIVEMYMMQEYGTILSLVGLLFLLATIILFILFLAFISASVRRLHDAGKSGFYMLLPVALAFSSILVFVVAVASQNPDLLFLIVILQLAHFLTSLYILYLLIKPSSLNTTYGPLLPAFQAPMKAEEELVEEDNLDQV